MTHAPLQAAVLGALVADAAALGFHWLYDVDRLHERAGDSPTFRAPDPANYDDAFGFFAHKGKRAGDPSHYGEGLRTMLRFLAERPSAAFSPSLYQVAFRDTFGPGGSWCGYIDHPTRLTLRHLQRAERATLEAAQEAAAALPKDTAGRLIQKVLPYTRELRGADLDEPVRQAVAMAYQDPALVEAALHIAHAIDAAHVDASGADDEQIPALECVPALLARYGDDLKLSEHLEAAVRVTHHNELAVACARFFAALLLDLARETPLEESATRHLALLPEPVRTSTARALQIEPMEIRALSESFGRACYLGEALPLSLAILRQTSSFREASEQNVLAGGDSCGRALVVGAIAAIQHGVGGPEGLPYSWLLGLHHGQEAAAWLEAL